MLNCLTYESIAANSLQAFRTTTVLTVLIVLLEMSIFNCSLIVSFNEQESCYFPPCSVVIFVRLLISCMCDYFPFCFFFFFLSVFLSKGAIFSIHNLHSLYHATLWDARCCHN